ncbi:hypothetical protein OUZ56_032618, partial [Daphnia magna]
THPGKKRSSPPKGRHAETNANSHRAKSGAVGASNGTANATEASGYLAPAAGVEPATNALGSRSEKQSFRAVNPQVTRL